MRSSARGAIAAAILSAILLAVPGTGAAQVLDLGLPGCTPDTPGDQVGSDLDLRLVCLEEHTDDGLTLTATGTWPDELPPRVAWRLTGSSADNPHHVDVIAEVDRVAVVEVSDLTQRIARTCAVPRTDTDGEVVIGPLPHRCIDLRGDVSSTVTWSVGPDSDTVELGGTIDLDRVRVRRLDGGTPAGTSAEVADHAIGWPAQTAYLTRDDDVVDALTGGSLRDGPILRTPSCGPIPAAVQEALRRHRPDRVVALGGEGAICDGTLQAAADIVSAARLARSVAPGGRCTRDVHSTAAEPDRAWHDVVRSCLSVDGQGRLTLEVHAAAAAPDEDGAAGMFFVLSLDGIGDPLYPWATRLPRFADVQPTGPSVVIARGELTRRRQPGGPPGSGGSSISGDDTLRDVIVVANGQELPCETGFAIAEDLTSVTVTVADIACAGAWEEVVGTLMGRDLMEDIGPVATPGLAAVATGRLAGASRFETAVAIAREAYPDGAEEVLIARAEEFADVVAAGLLDSGPLLLVPSCGPLPGVVADELARLLPSRLTVLGGPSAVCEATVDAAASAGGSQGTARRCVDDPVDTPSGTDLTGLCLRRTAEGTWVEVILDGRPVRPPSDADPNAVAVRLMVDGADVTHTWVVGVGATTEWLQPGPGGPGCEQARLEVTTTAGSSTWRIGPIPDACLAATTHVDAAATAHTTSPNSAVDEVPDDRDPVRLPLDFGAVPVERIAGQTRLHTAVAVATRRWPSDAQEYGERADVAYLGSAHDFSHTVAVGTSPEGPLLLVPTCGDLPTVVADELARLGPTEVVALGGTAQVCDEVLTAAAAAAGGNRRNP